MISVEITSEAIEVSSYQVQAGARLFIDVRAVAGGEGFVVVDYVDTRGTSHREQTRIIAAEITRVVVQPSCGSTGAPPLPVTPGAEIQFRTAAFAGERQVAFGNLAVIEDFAGFEIRGVHPHLVRTAIAPATPGSYTVTVTLDGGSTAHIDTAADHVYQPPPPGQHAGVALDTTPLEVTPPIGADEACSGGGTDGNCDPSDPDSDCVLDSDWSIGHFSDARSEDALGLLDSIGVGLRTAIFTGAAPNVITFTSPLTGTTRQLMVGDEDFITGVGDFTPVTLRVGEQHCLYPYPTRDGLPIQGALPVRGRLAAAGAAIAVNPAPLPSDALCLRGVAPGESQLTATWGAATDTRTWRVLP